MQSDESDTKEKFIVELLKQGNENAFSSLFRDYGKRLFCFCYGYLKSREDAEELVQETFVRVWESRTAIDSNYSFGGFIFTIAHRLVLNRLRKIRNERAGNQYWCRGKTGVSNETEDRIIYADLGRRVKDAISALPPKRKAIYHMIKDDNMTYQQVADKLNISVKTVEAQMSQALKYLRKVVIVQNLAVITVSFLF